MRLERTLRRRTDRYIERLAKKHRLYTATVLPLAAALADPHLAPRVRRWLGSVVAAGGEACQCLCCERPWAMPAAVLVIEPGQMRAGLCVGLCLACARADGLEERVSRGMEADLGLDPKAWRRVGQAGHA